MKAKYGDVKINKKTNDSGRYFFQFNSNIFLICFLLLSNK